MKRVKNAKSLREKHAVSLHSTGISQVVKIKDVKKLQQDTENNLFVRDLMANLSCLLVCTFGYFLALVLVAAHTVNNIDLGLKQSFDNEGYESNSISKYQKRLIFVILYRALRYKIFSKVIVRRKGCLQSTGTVC